MIERCRFAASAFLFAAALVASSALIFIFGALGLRSNSVLTGCYLLCTIGGTLVLGWRPSDKLVLTFTDKIFAVFAVTTALAACLHFNKEDFKEYTLLALNTVFAYLAGRSLCAPVLVSLRLRMLQLTSPLIVLACIMTIPNLIGEEYARPFVFGFFHATTAFCIAFGYLVISYIFSDIDWKSGASLFFGLLIALATAIFVASTVRFVLMALFITTFFSLSCSFIGSIKIRNRVAVVLLMMFIGTAAGTISRYAFVISIKEKIDDSGAISAQALHPSSLDPKRSNQNIVTLEQQKTTDRPNIKPPSCSIAIDLNNSIAIRRAILNDAVFFLPLSGFFGLGLNYFSKASCFEGYQVHNSVLQVAIEFGWIAGGAMTILLATPFLTFLRYRRKSDPTSLFLLSCIAFVTLLSLVYGQPSRDLQVFLFLGAFAKLTSLPAKEHGDAA
jgi:hypothetical protein